MKLCHLVLAGLLGNALGGHSNHQQHHAVHKRFSALERRAREYKEAALMRREDFTCGEGKPCGNGACCGKDGWCGYGPTYCGTGCTSNCDAHAECGEYAVPAGTTCPLNTCCSEFGFCGTTKDFCTGKCQSNCVEHPEPPGGAGGGKTLSKVIGYYEAWNDRSKCHQTSAKDLPVDGLTHLNYAFAFLDPTSFKLTTMDAATPAKTFQDVADLKVLNPNLEIFVSIGGWTFSDNDTATQPVFGNIARSSANRQTFANNVLKFLDTYGYDGVDIDWEYPGAPDRGGKPDDVKNYVLMLQTLRKTFDASGRKLGITLTAPSSFWYLRWFDLPGMIKYVDWINVMSYDLHGIWDSSNPIGSIVQAHTNLTEIKLAAELFWRAKVPPSKLALGFGFYGRAFTLADPSCTTPGCPFKGGAKPGACTDTSGYLAHYEIQDIISKNKKRGLTPVYDKTAAVKYMAWDDNQWISYDDADTFKDKIKWADDIGFAGSLIWASDLDDYEFSAHKALLDDTSIGKRSVAEPIVAEIDASFGQNCYKEENEFKQTCDAGYTKVGADRDGVNCDGIDESLCGRIICCPKTSGMTECSWRGSGGDCNGQCHEGEVKVSSSSYGGHPGESSETKKCSRGDKAFCCKTTQYDSLTDGCRWTDKCGNECDSDEESVAYAYDHWGWGTVFCHGNHYCCKKDRPIPFKNCHWVGKGDCADNTCSKSEVTLWTNDRGDTYGGCNWYRKKALCCTPNADALEEHLCDFDPCKDDPDFCDDGGGEEVDIAAARLARRTYIDPEDGLEYSYLEKRGAARPGMPRKSELVTKAGKLIWHSRPYPTGDKRDKLFRVGKGLATMTLRGGYGKASQVCTNAVLKWIKIADLAKNGFQTEHLFENQLPKKLLETAISGILPHVGLGVTPVLNAAPITDANLMAGWNKLYGAGIKLNDFFEAITDVPKNYVAPLNTPADRLMTAIGDWGNMQNLLLVEGHINWVKGKLWSLSNPMAASKLTTLLNSALKGNANAGKQIEVVLQSVFSVFSYMNDAGAEITWRTAYKQLNQEIMNMDKHMPELKGIKAIFDEFMPAYQKAISTKAVLFVQDVCGQVSMKVTAAMAAKNPDLGRLLWTAAYYSKQTAKLKWDTKLT